MLNVAVSSLARSMVEYGGCAYFLEPALAPFVAAGELHPINGAPEFRISVQIASLQGGTGETLRLAAEALAAWRPINATSCGLAVLSPPCAATAPARPGAPAVAQFRIAPVR